MAKSDTKTELLKVGADLFHKKGYNNTGIQEILKEAGVPKGSFYFYFESKEDFGLQVLDLYSEIFFTKMRKYLKNYALNPVDRLKQFFDDFLYFFENNNSSGGCPVGNLSQELGDLNSAFREKLNEMLNQMKEEVLYCLKEAHVKKQIDTAINLPELAEFIINGWEGALIKMKVAKNTESLRVFDAIVFDSLLK